MTDQEHKGAELSTESNGNGIVACWLVKEMHSPVKLGLQREWHCGSRVEERGAEGGPGIVRIITSLSRRN